MINLKGSESGSHEAEMLGIRQDDPRPHKRTVLILKIVSVLSIVVAFVGGLVVVFAAVNILHGLAFLLWTGLILIFAGVVVSAFFSTLALIVENLVAIRKELSDSRQKNFN